MADSIFDADELEAAAVKPDEAPQEAAGAAQEAEAGASEEKTAEAPAGAPEASGEPEAGTEEKPTTVPHEALHAERERRKRIEQELAAERAARQREAERISRIEEMLRPKPEAPKPLPPIADDPIAHIAHIGQTTEQLREMFARQQEQAQQAQELQIVHQTLEQAEQSFRSSAPDYDAAADHLYQSRQAELRYLGVPEAQIGQMISAEIYQVAQTALRSGRNPAEVFYETAKARGYRAGGGQATPAQQQAPVVDAAAKVAAINAGQAAAKSLGAAPGAAPAADLSIRALLELSDDEFAKIDPAAFRRVAGG